MSDENEYNDRWADCDEEEYDAAMGLPDGPRCACPYCTCFNEVEYVGETCSDCRQHAHQG